MANNKSIQILRGGPNYDPSTSTEILLDGQPFYSKKTKKLYIGDGTSELKQLPGIDIDLNIENGEGVDSLVQKYSGAVDSTHYGNTNTGESAVVFGEANTNSANRALLSGKLNFNSGAQVILGGINNSNNAPNTIQGGKGNKNTTEDAIVGGKYCIDTKNALLKIGNGTDDNHRSNAFEVLTTGGFNSYGTSSIIGRLEVSDAPSTANDVVRKFEIDTLINNIADIAYTSTNDKGKGIKGICVLANTATHQQYEYGSEAHFFTVPGGNQHGYAKGIFISSSEKTAGDAIHLELNPDNVLTGNFRNSGRWNDSSDHIAVHDYADDGKIAEKFKSIESRLNSLGFKRGSVTGISGATLTKQGKYAILFIPAHRLYSNGIGVFDKSYSMSFTAKQRIVTYGSDGFQVTIEGSAIKIYWDTNSGEPENYIIKPMYIGFEISSW